MDQESEEGKDKTSPDKQAKSPQVSEHVHEWGSQHTTTLLGSILLGCMGVGGATGVGCPSNI